jgi:hypothetical protein
VFQVCWHPSARPWMKNPAGVTENLQYACRSKEAGLLINT